jgi:hypothetical protein
MHRHHRNFDARVEVMDEGIAQGEDVMPKRTPEQVWRIAEKEAIEDELEFQRACNTSVADRSRGSGA